MLRSKAAENKSNAKILREASKHCTTKVFVICEEVSPLLSSGGARGLLASSSFYLDVKIEKQSIVNQIGGGEISFFP